MIIKSSNSRILGDYSLLTIEFKSIIPATRIDETDLNNKWAIIGHTKAKQVILSVLDTEQEAINILKAIYNCIPLGISLDQSDKPVEIR